MHVQGGLNSSLPAHETVAAGPSSKAVSVLSSQPVVGNLDEDSLLPIDAVARLFGIRASTLRYYEERDLVAPVSRHSGRRWYGSREIRRIAVIRFWQRQGLMSLDVIRELLDGSSHLQWQEIVQQHITAMQEQVEQLQRVQSFIAEALSCEYHDHLDDCPDYEELIRQEIGKPRDSAHDTPS